MLARFPGVLAAVVGASLVLTLIAGAGPLFVSSAANASLRDAMRRAPPEAFTMACYGPISDAFIGGPDRELAAETASLPGVSAPRVSIVGAPMTISAAGARVQVTPVSTPGFETHLSGATGGTGGGLWLDAATASSLGVASGDAVTVALPSGSTSVGVAGVFDAVGSPRSSFWGPVSAFVGAGSHDTPPPAFASQATMTGFEERVGGSGRFVWTVPLRTRTLSLAQADALSGQLQVMRVNATDTHTPLGASFHTDRFGIQPPYAATALPGLVAEANDVAAATKGPVDTVALAGWLLALFGVAAAGTFGVRRRRVEASLLSARGAGPLVQGARAVLDAVIPVGAGGVAGFVLARLLIGAIGPSSFVDAAARAAAVRDAVWTLVIALAVLGVAAGMASRLEFEEVSGRARRVLARTPWEAVVLVLAGVTLYEVLSRSGVAAGAAPHVDRLLVLFPVLFTASLGGILVRLLGRALAKTRTLGRGWRAGPYLAMRRIGSAPRLALLLVAGASLAFGILVFSGAVSRSVSSSAQDKALLRLGADAVVPVAGAPAHAVPDATVVGDFSGHAVASARPILLHAIDPATFARGVAWSGSFSSTPLDRLVGMLSAASQGDPLPVVVAGPGIRTSDAIGLGGTAVPIRVVARTSGLPGTPGADVSVVLASRPALEAIALRVSQPRPPAPPLTTSPLASQGATHLWLRGDDAAILDRLRAAGIPARGLMTATAVAGTPAFLAVSWTFDFLKAIGAITAVVAILGVVLYLQARQRDREVSYALASRMGLSSGSHRVSVALELAAMLLAAFVIGAGLGLASSAIVLGKLDVLPSAPPPPSFRLPLSLLGVGAAAIVVVSILGALVVQRAAGRARVAEVLRLAR